jgi:hypothetical protein
MADDKKTIGLTEQSKATLDLMVEEMGFKRDMDAAKFAFAFAVQNGSEPIPVEGTGTIWNVGTLDEGGDLKTLIENLYPHVEQPYRALESLMNVGLGLLAEERKTSGTLRVEDLVRRSKSDSDSVRDNRSKENES